MAGIIVADTIQSGGSFIRLNSASQTVATINASGIYANTGNLLIAANGTIGVASITNTAITGTITQAQIGNGVATTGPAFSAYPSSNQSISSGVWTKLQFNVEEFDTASCFDNSTNYRFTPNVAGYYQVNGKATIATSGTNYCLIRLYKNGSGTFDGQTGIASAASYANSIISNVIYLNGTTDYLELYVLHNTGTTQTTQGAIGQVNFQSVLIRAA